jgi:hypothetical protein
MKKMSTTPVYDAYWQFAYNRQEVFFNRMIEKSAPWTNDPVLQKYKFTNVYRVEDRVSQYLIRNVIYTADDFSPEDTLFRILLFKLFNKIETWQTLERSVGRIAYSSYNRNAYRAVFQAITESKEKLYSAAYIMPSGKTSFGFNRKFENNLSLLELMMSEGISGKIAKIRSLKELYEVLLSYPTIGKFLAFQFAIDINYSELCDFSEMSFVVAGPGARRGIEKCFNIDKPNYEDLIRYVADKQIDEFDNRGLPFRTLFGRPLQLIDCQNLFCETDKYARVAFPDASSKTERTRIKQNFKPHSEPINYFFPPKWGLRTTEEV